MPWKQQSTENQEIRFSSVLTLCDLEQALNHLDLNVLRDNGDWTVDDLSSLFQI